MEKKYCPNGHLYDPSIYGDQCPMCGSQVNMPPRQGMPPRPQPANSLKTNIAGNPQQGPGMGMGMGGPRPGMPQQQFDNHTHVAGGPQGPAPRPQGPAPRPFPQGPAGAPRPFGQQPQGPKPQGETQMRPQGNAPKPQGTVIRMPGKDPIAGNGRHLVGFLVTYNRNPNGRAYNIYEGRNFIGRDTNNDISIPDDTLMSGRHMSILYRSADHKFKFRDEQSSNGTYINKELIDEGELQNYDIIRIGSTIFIFIAIPKIG